MPLSSQGAACGPGVPTLQLTWGESGLECHKQNETSLLACGLPSGPLSPDPQPAMAGSYRRQLRASEEKQAGMQGTESPKGEGGQACDKEFLCVVIGSC